MNQRNNYRRIDDFEVRSKMEMLSQLLQIQQHESPPGRLVARVNVMKLAAPGSLLKSGSPGCNGMKTAPLCPLLTRSSP